MKPHILERLAWVIMTATALFTTLITLFIYWRRYG